MINLRSLCAAALLLLSLPLYATEAKDVKTFSLDNGMKFLVLEDHSIPNANMYLFWKVGSRNEVPGITGLSHFFEHMMFNGSANYGPKMFDRTMEAAGGANNAYTTENTTVYTDWFPAPALETIFKLEADRIGALSLDDKMVESERGVVTSERSTGLENSNFRTIWEEVKGIAFRAHPYSWPVIGHQSDIDSWSTQDLADFFKTYYAPNNAVVVISGDVDTAQVKQLAQRYFGPIPASEAPRAVRTVEPPQKGERRVFVAKASVTSPNLMIGYKIPASSHKDYFALSLLASLLGDGNSSRLHRQLVDEQQLATEVFTYMPESFDPNLFYIYAIAADGVSAEALEQGIYSVLAAVKAEGVDADELQKAKNGKLMEFYRTLETINGKADTLGTYELFFGGYENLFKAPQDYNRVSLEDIQTAARLYFSRAQRSVGILAKTEPTDAPATAAAAIEQGE